MGNEVTEAWRAAHRAAIDLCSYCSTLRRDAEAGADTADFYRRVMSIRVLRHQHLFIDTLLQKRWQRRGARTW